MFKLDIQVFNAIVDYCKVTGQAFGFGVWEGAFINFTAIAGAILIGLNSKGNKK